MEGDNTIPLSGPFSLTDSLGRSWQVSGMHIHDEGYGIIDVYVQFAASLEDEALYADAVVLAQLMARLHALGYAGPDFGAGDPGLQDDHHIVLEAPEAFCEFAERLGWRNLAEHYGEDMEGSDAIDTLADAESMAVYSALMRRLMSK